MYARVMACTQEKTNVTSRKKKVRFRNGKKVILLIKLRTNFERVPRVYSNERYFSLLL